MPPELSGLLHREQRSRNTSPVHAALSDCSLVRLIRHDRFVRNIVDGDAILARDVARLSDIEIEYAEVELSDRGGRLLLRDTGGVHLERRNFFAISLARVDALLVKGGASRKSRYGNAPVL